LVGACGGRAPGTGGGEVTVVSGDVGSRKTDDVPSQPEAASAAHTAVSRSFMGGDLGPRRIAPARGEVLNEFWEFAAVSLVGGAPAAIDAEA
jgi:hypothetical protein